MYQVFKFECDSSILALPISWVVNGQVQFHPTLMRSYIIGNKMPPRSWKTYKVSAIGHRKYDTFDQALIAEELLLDLSDINSSDVASNSFQHKKYKSEKKVFKHIEDRSTDSCDDSLPAIPIKSRFGRNTKASENVLTECALASEYDVSVPVAEVTIPSMSFLPSDSIVSPNIIEEEIVVDPHPNQNEDSFSSITISTVDNSMIRAIVRDELTKFKDEMKSMIQEVLGDMAEKSVGSRVNKISFERLNSFPLKNLEDLRAFDSRYDSDSVLQEHFKCYVKQFGGRNVKENLKILSRVYDLELQKCVSFTGREAKKFPLKNLSHIKAVIEILGAVFNETERNVTLQIQRYFQQTCDRIRSAGKCGSSSSKEMNSSSTN